ncbi:hypothetical protein [Kribbella sp. DT2]|uniref:hypothetical protein n=1 Tax=Kribbella sp. DT2 TaxID=3393427 RepID=UPI003CF97F1F
MSGSSFQDMLDDAKASSPTDVDTSFLDEFRRTGVAPSVQAGEPTAENRDGVADEPKFDDAIDPASVAQGLPAEPERGGPVVDGETAGRAGAARMGRGNGRGGAATSGSPAAGGSTTAQAQAPGPASTASPFSDGAGEGLDVGADEGPGAVQELDSALDAEAAQRLDHLAEVELSAHRKTDQQDAIQAATGTKRGSASSTPATLPESGFRIEGPQSQPMVRNLPRQLVEAMRAQVRAAAVRERGVSDGAAEAFSRRLSQGALVTAFLLAQLDVRIGTDPATGTAAELFRSQDPLLGAVADRMERLEQLERSRAAQLEKLQQVVTDVQETGAVIEQAVAYSIADRTVNFLRGSHDIHDAPITHEDAIYIRDRVRDETEKRRRLERARDGRPIR